MAQSTKKNGRRERNAKPSRPLVPEEILDEAAHLFSSAGYRRTRMQDIAAKFGVTHAALYYHFESKQAMLAQINVRELKLLLDKAEAIVNQDATSSEKLLGLIRHHMWYIATHPQLAATLLEHDMEIAPVDLAQIATLRRQYTETFIALYEDGAEAGELPRIQSIVAVSIVLGACNWIHRWYQASGPLAPDQLVDQAMGLMRRILFSPEPMTSLRGVTTSAPPGSPWWGWYGHGPAPA